MTAELDIKTSIEFKQFFALSCQTLKQQTKSSPKRIFFFQSAKRLAQRLAEVIVSVW